MGWRQQGFQVCYLLLLTNQQPTTHHMNQHTSPNPARQTGLNPESLHLGMPHPTIPNIFFIKYRYGRPTPEQWGTLDQLNNKRKKIKKGI